MAILLIEHDMSVVMGISDHVVVLDYGKKISDGTPEHVRNDPAVIRAYLGVEDVEEELKAIAAAPAAAAPAAQAVKAPLPKLSESFKSERVSVPPPPVLSLPDDVNMPVAKPKAAAPAAPAPAEGVTKKAAAKARAPARPVKKTAAKKTPVKKTAAKKTSKTKGGRA
jgi:branched-chain amino acid transport system ATP-binding protein